MVLGRGDAGACYVGATVADAWSELYRGCYRWAADRTPEDLIFYGRSEDPEIAALDRAREWTGSDPAARPFCVRISGPEVDCFWIWRLLNGAIAEEDHRWRAMVGPVSDPDVVAIDILRAEAAIDDLCAEVPRGVAPAGPGGRSPDERGRASEPAERAIADAFGALHALAVSLPVSAFAGLADHIRAYRVSA